MLAQIKKYRKELLIKFLVYGSLGSIYYMYNVFMFQGSFLYKETILVVIVLSLLVGSLYGLWYAIDKALAFIKNKKGKKVISIIIKLLLIFFILWPSMVTVFQIHRIKVGNTKTPTITSKYDNISFETVDGVTIKGWYLKHINSKKTIIFGHGLGVNRTNFLEYAKSYQSIGYNVLIFDFRGHGDSDGHTVSFGHHEAKDILAATNYLKENYPEDTQNIYGVGFSMGASSMIYAQSEYKLFDKLVIDSSFAYSENMIDHMYRSIPDFYKEYLKFFSSKLSVISIGTPVTQIIPGEKIKDIEIPILFFHGKEDQMIPYTESTLLFENKNNKDNSKIIIFEKSGHVSSLVDEYDKYMNSAKEFLNK